MNLTTNTHAAYYTNGCRTFWAAARCQLLLLVRFMSHQQTQLRASTESFPIFVSFVQLTWKPVLFKIINAVTKGFCHTLFHPSLPSRLLLWPICWTPLYTSSQGNYWLQWRSRLPKEHLWFEKTALCLWRHWRRCIRLSACYGSCHVTFVCGEVVPVPHHSVG